MRPGVGGNGVDMGGGSSFTTTFGTVAGGNGIYVSPGTGAADGGNGGAAVFLQGGAQFTIEASEIVGGTGGVGGNSPVVGDGLSGTGGTGVILQGAGETLTNLVLPVPGGVIQGGQGGAGHAGGAGAGAGGMGVNIFGGGGSFDNQCIVTGGAGGYANDTTGSAAAANGGIGGVLDGGGIHASNTADGGTGTDITLEPATPCYRRGGTCESRPSMRSTSRAC